GLAFPSRYTTRPGRLECHSTCITSLSLCEPRSPPPKPQIHSGPVRKNPNLHPWSELEEEGGGKEAPYSVNPFN
ncbi:hypothetical protein JOQ06_023441, partial [Pogonophryne albipinna]